MSTILVEARKDPGIRPALDLIAQTCRSLGHDVYRWRGPLSGRVGYWRWLFRCDLAILFNGTHEKYAPVLARLAEMQARLLFVELGWNPQRGTVQIDPAGINARASWAAEPLGSAGGTPLAVRPQGDLLVVLQLDGDTQITQLSPWFANMRQLVEHVCQNSALPVRVRAHPRQPPAADFVRRVEQLGGTWDRSSSLAEALAGCRAVACINSSCGVEAMSHGLPVLCYGLAHYRHAGAAYCLTNTAAQTRRVTEGLAAGKCELHSERCEELLARILQHQVSFADIPQRLPALLGRVLGSEATPRKTDGWKDRAARILRDLPGLWERRRTA